MVVAQLVERLLLTPEVRGSNPVIGKFYIEHYFLSTVLKRRKYRKSGREWPIQKTIREGHLMDEKTMFSYHRSGPAYVDTLSNHLLTDSGTNEQPFLWFKIFRKIEKVFTSGAAT